MSMTKRRGSVAMSVVCAALSAGVAPQACAALGGGSLRCYPSYPSYNLGRQGTLGPYQ